MNNSLYGALGGGNFDEQQYQMDLMKRMNQQNQAGLAQALAMQGMFAAYPVPNPEPNKVLLLLGDDE